MHAKRNLLIGVGASFMLAGFVWLAASRALRRAEDSLAALTARRAGLISDIQRVESRLAAAERRQVDLTQMHDHLGPVKPPMSVPTVMPSPRTQSELIANNPKLEVLELKRQRAVVLLEFGSFFRKRALSSAQIEQFTDNWVKSAEQNMDLRAAARTQDEAGQQTVATLQQKAKDEYAAAQAEVLGTEGYRQMEEYVRTEPLQNIVIRGLAGAAALEGIPLTALQGEQLLQAALHSSAGHANGDGEQLVRTVDWDALNSQARQILSAEQFALFTTVAPPSGFRSRWEYQLDEAIRRAQQADATAAPAPAPMPTH